jgi:hypothetical protein
MKDGRDERKGKKWGEVCVERRERIEAARQCEVRGLNRVELS